MPSVRRSPRAPVIATEGRYTVTYRWDAVRRTIAGDLHPAASARHPVAIRDRVVQALDEIGLPGLLLLEAALWRPLAGSRGAECESADNRLAFGRRRPNAHAVR